MNFIVDNIEQIENVLGLTVLVLCTITMFVKRTWPNDDIRLFSRGFFGTALLGDAYYTIYALVFGFTPQYFYGAELAWLAEELFLLLLVVEVFSKEGLSPIRPVSWIGPIIIALLTIWFIVESGSPVINILMGCAMSGIALFALSALFGAREDHASGIARHRGFYLATASFVAIEYVIWSCSIIDKSVSIANSYYWFNPILYVTLICVAVAIVHFEKFDDGEDG